MLEAKRINKKYGKRSIFNNLNFKIDKPGLYLITGNNGIGKTTLFNIIGKFTTFKGKIKNSHKDSMGYLFQNSYLIEYLTIKEHLELFGVSSDVLSKFNLDNKLDSYPDNLSSGEKQRIGLIIMLYSNNELILLDEPFANLDEINVKLFIREIL